MSLLRNLVLACVVAALPIAATAEDYPARTIKIIVPNPPGGAGDISARLVGQKLSETFRQPVVVENQAGASGAIGLTMLKRAAPDGYTIGVLLSLSQTVDRIQNKSSSFDIAKDFTPITAIANNPAGLLVNDQIATKSMAEFIADARRRPGAISYGSAGIGTAHHLYGQMLNKVAGIDLLAVPYRGVAPALNDLLGGHIPVAIVSLATALPHLQSGRIRLLTVFDSKRYSKVPNVPAISEVLPDYHPGRAWVGFIGPPRLPPAIAGKLHDEMARALRSADVVRVLEEDGLEIIANTPAEFAAMIGQDGKIWDDAAAMAGLISSP